MIQTDTNSNVDNANLHESKRRLYRLTPPQNVEFIVYVCISVSFVSSTFGLVSIYIIYVWVCVSLYHLRLGGVSLYCLRLCSFTIGFVSVCIAYIWSGVSLFHLRFGVVSVYIIYVWIRGHHPNVDDID
jgi:hypothetical protein